MSSTELKPIILYDIPCTTPGRPWSPHTMKARYCLGYKQLPFTTVWVELPDIAGLHQLHGITQPPYTLPAIKDPNTGAYIMESFAIATYLDETYPEKPRVLHPAVPGLLQEFETVFSLGSQAGSAVAGTGTSAGANNGGDGDSSPRLVFVFLGVERLHPISQSFYHRTREARLGERWTTLRDACSAGLEERAERVRQGIESIKVAWRQVTAMYDGEDGGKSCGPFILGAEPCFLDFAVAGRIKYILDGLDPSEAEMLTNLEGGRLARLVESLGRYFKY